MVALCCNMQMTFESVYLDHQTVGKGVLIQFINDYRNTIPQTVPEKADVSYGGQYAPRHTEEITKQVKFREPMSTSVMDYPNVQTLQNERVSSSDWPSGSSFDRPHDDPHYPQYLPSGLEEHSSSSISEGTRILC